MSQPCPYCGNREFEEEDGLLVCTSCGRQQEGGLQVADDDADFGTQGKLVRRKVERQKVKVTKIYRGARAYKLYLQAWQHIMWRQSYALIHGSTKAPSDLWTVARDLWTLKLSSLLHRLDDHTKATTDDGSASSSDHDVSAATEFVRPQERSERHLRLSLKLWDTISLVYLSALLIRYPISLSNIYNLIRSEDIPFMRASRFVPYEITSHLPSEYQLALDTVTIPQRHELQRTTFQFIRSFASDFGMDIPALNWRILLYKWIVELGLPLDIYDTVKSLANLLDYNFTYQLPTKTTPDVDLQAEKRRFRRTPVAMPEIQLISLIIVATKLLFPFPVPDPSLTTQTTRPSTLQSSPPEPEPEPAPHPNPLADLTLDWPTWLALQKSNATNQPSGPQKHIETSDKDISNMSPEELDDYISWYQRTFTTPDHVLRQKKTDLEMSILDLFPAPEMSPAQQTSESQETAQRDMAKATFAARIQSSALRYNPYHAPAIYPIFTSLNILTSTNKYFEEQAESTIDTEDPSTSTSNPILYFHELAARVACTDMQTLVRAVRYTEGKMEAWIDKRRRGREWEGVSDGEEEEQVNK